MLKHRNIKLMILIIIFVIIFLGIGSIMLNALFFKKNNDIDSYKTSEDISVPIVTNVGLPDGDIDVNNDIVQKLFSYFREDHNCVYNYVANINGSNKTKLMLAYNNLVDSSGVITSCSKYSSLVISDRYFCGNSIDINHNYYDRGINSSEFINYLKSNNTVEVDGGELDQAMNSIFGNGVGYIKEDFLYSNDSYIHYDSSINKYVMYKYFNNSGVCKNYNEELVSASSNGGMLEIRSKLMEGNNTIRNIKRDFKFDSNTGKYIFQNRYLL